MQRLFNVSKWSRLVEGGALSFESNRPRVVRLEVNSRMPVGLYLLDVPSGATMFLATTCGRDTVEFHCGGNFSLVSDGECYIYTADGESIHHESPDPVIFTRIADRRGVPPEIRAITETMNRNLERRLAQQASEFNAILRGFAESQQRNLGSGLRPGSPGAAVQPLPAPADVGGDSAAGQPAAAPEPVAAASPAPAAKRRGAPS